MVVPMLGFLLSTLGYSILKHISFIVTRHQTIFQNTTVPLKSTLPVASHFTRDESRLVRVTDAEILEYPVRNQDAR